MRSRFNCGKEYSREKSRESERERGTRLAAAGLLSCWSWILFLSQLLSISIISLSQTNVSVGYLPFLYLKLSLSQTFSMSILILRPLRSRDRESPIVISFCSRCFAISQASPQWAHNDVVSTFIQCHSIVMCLLDHLAWSMMKIRQSWV